MKTVAIIQARMGSSRLPGKVLMDVAGQTVLQRVVSRTLRCKEVDQVVVATSTLPMDDAVVAACELINVPAFRGDELDVLSRFFQAAQSYDADLCVRITADCPLIDPQVSDYIIRCFKNAHPPVDYASNKIPQSYPRGLDTEVFTIGALQRTWLQAIEPYQRSHVTIYMYEHPEKFKLLSITSEIDRADWRWTVDTPEDLEFVRQVYRHLGSHGLFSWIDVINLLTDKPRLRAVNAMVSQKSPNTG